jgi:plastocyanin
MPPTPEPPATATPVPLFTAADIIRFALPNIDISAGTTITWTNLDGAPHTVTAGDPGAVTGEFDSGVFNLGGTYSLAFDTPGQFAYFCVIHPSMQAAVFVQ